MTPLLDIREVRVHFDLGGGGLLRRPRQLRALNGVSLSVDRGEVLAVVGESGCGKSTLARTVLGIERPHVGRVLFDGKDIRSYARDDLAARMQPVFQDPYSSLNPRKTVHDLIAMPMRVAGRHGGAEVDRTVAEAMDRVGLPRRMMHSYPGAMSGGQRQRIAIARAIVTRPAMIICDEPTSALDVSVQAQILNLLRELKRELGLTYLFISHNLSVINYLADRVAVMYLGRVVELGPTRQVLHRPAHPYTRLLLAAALEPGRGRRIDRAAFARDFPDPTDPPPGCHFHPRCPDAMPICATRRPGTVQADGRMVACHLYTGLAPPRPDPATTVQPAEP